MDYDRDSLKPSPGFPQVKFTGPFAFRQRDGLLAMDTKPESSLSSRNRPKRNHNDRSTLSFAFATDDTTTVPTRQEFALRV